MSPVEKTAVPLIPLSQLCVRPSAKQKNLGTQFASRKRRTPTGLTGHSQVE